MHFTWRNVHQGKLDINMRCTGLDRTESSRVSDSVLAIRISYTGKSWCGGRGLEEGILKKQSFRP